VSAVARPEPLRLVPMTLSDLDAVMAVEQAAYEFPWTRGNMVDSLLTGHHASVLLAPDGAVVGYFVAMGGVEEMHLLNLLAASEALDDRPERAVQIAAAAEVFTRQEGIVNVYTDQTPWLEIVDRARAQLSAEGAAHAADVGRRLTINEALALARDGERAPS